MNENRSWRHSHPGALSRLTMVAFAALAGYFTMVSSTHAQPPDWSLDAIWYQVFPERFSNGDAANDPDVASLEGTWPYRSPKGWKPSPWTSDWYELQPWEKDGEGFYHHAQLRRYGGDLQGIINKLDYLKDLGVNALYLNPVFDSPSLHKYGARMYHHIDRHFGQDPKGDAALYERENPEDPKSWEWSAADKLFLKLIREVHARKMRIIIDGVFNHAGIPFWALQRAKKTGPESKFADWFVIKDWDPPHGKNFEYEGWAGIRDLPVFRQRDGRLHPDLEAHFQAVISRWMDPNGDGDPSDGIDGWRLDVAAEMPMPFWNALRGWIKAINPNAYLSGEIWWDNYKAHKLKNAAPWLGPAFDGVMNYRFGNVVLQFFNQSREPWTAKHFSNEFKRIHRDYGYDQSLGLMNLFASHDTARIASYVANPSQLLGHGANLKRNKRYVIRKPTAKERLRQKQMLAFQFIAPGAPYIYYGDEAGMWGASDPDCRKPMVWPDLEYNDEIMGPFGKKRSKPDQVSFDTELHAFYRALCRMRNNHACLRRGKFKMTSSEAPRSITIERSFQGEKVRGIFNAGPNRLPVSQESGWNVLPIGEDGKIGEDSKIPKTIGARAYLLLVQRKGK